MYMYIYIYIYIYIYKFTSKLHSQTTHPESGDSQGQETFLAPSADKEIRIYDTDYSNHHPSPSTLRSKGLSCSKMMSHIYKFTSK